MCCGNKVIGTQQARSMALIFSYLIRTDMRYMKRKNIVNEVSITLSWRPAAVFEDCEA
jgi:hypothetical protein